MIMILSRLALIALFLVRKCSSANGFGNHRFRDTAGLSDFEVREIQRQNQITKRILQNYLEKKLYGKRLTQPPTLQDILPNGMMGKPPRNNIQELLGNSTQENENKETLDSDETENVDFYEEYEDESPRISDGHRK